MSTRCILYYTRYTYTTYTGCTRSGDFSPYAYAYDYGYAYTCTKTTATASSYICFNTVG